MVVIAFIDAAQSARVRCIGERIRNLAHLMRKNLKLREDQKTTGWNVRAVQAVHHTLLCNWHRA